VEEDLMGIEVMFSLPTKGWSHIKKQDLVETISKESASDVACMVIKPKTVTLQVAERSPTLPATAMATKLILNVSSVATKDTLQGIVGKRSQL
jgi:hypothetical protein